jgi:hypothetical protein
MNWHFIKFEIKYNQKSSVENINYAVNLKFE